MPTSARRRSLPHIARWRFGPFELDEGRRQLMRGSELLILEPKPFNLLMLMLRHPGEVILKNDLIDALWTGRIVVDAVITNCVAKLRTVLGDEGATWIKTIHGFGYRFDCQPELLTDIVQEAAAPSLSLQAGDAIAARPNWQLLRRLGLSGDTWLAQHAKTHALRVFKFASDERGLSALKREVTIFRLLRASLGDKRCYSELLDWNFDEAPWFLELEYCAGGSLAEWFEAQGGILKVPLATRLELVARIADALAEVHVIGVLHKDLKPANVLVVPSEDPIPQIRLADFGAGRVLDAGRLAAFEITRMGFTQHIDTQADNSGTPLYLAPELLAGHPATVKADLYALGVMLYQCVVGSLRRPLSAGWELAIDDEMLREDIAAAAEGDPERRLGDAAEFARRIRSIETRRRDRETEREHQRKLEREARALERMRARRVGIIAAFAALVVGVIASAALYVDARKARDRALMEQARAEKIAVFLGEDMFRELLSYEHPVKDLTAKELLDSASAQVEKRFKDEPDIQARVLTSLGRGYQRLEYASEAESALKRAFDLHMHQSATPSVAVLEIAADLSRLEYQLGTLPTTIERYAALAVTGQKTLGATHPAVLKLRAALASSRSQLGDWMKAEQALLQLLLDVPVDRDSVHEDLRFRSTRTLASVQTRLAKYDAAERQLNILLTEARERYGADHEVYGDLEFELAEVYYRTERLADAEALLHDAEMIARRWGRDEQASPLTVRFHYAWLRLLQKRPLEAIALFKSVEDDISPDKQQGLDQRFYEDYPMALAYIDLRESSQAEALLQRAQIAVEKALSPQHPLAIQIRVALAKVWAESGRRNKAKKLLSCSSETDLPNLPDTHPILISYRQQCAALM